MSQQLSKEQLELLQGLQKQFNDSKFEIADLEIKKADLISGIADIKEKFAEQEKSLMEEFGQNAIINLQTGEVKEEEEKPLEAVE
ncbi:MAG: putative nucleic acid-binding Zn-ribbon protein [Flavobacteriaceae bacterium]|jgi:predicted  nucleic acid-binding Zn-ribbon protein|tara:strand:- start:96 stop:350 length:255 start_codon:yes stop_codon:yes gene_type:complete